MTNESVNNINFKDISVIVQGPIIENETIYCLKSIRKYLPGAEIILSTWKNSDTKGLDFDKLILNDDPSCTYSDKCKRIPFNLNRQIVSTQNGLKEVKRKYAFKLRSDLILTNNTFLEYFDKYQKRNNEFKLFNRKVLVATIFTRKYLFINHIKYYTPFSVSDFFIFGEREDLEKYLSSLNLMNEEDAYYFYNKEEDNPSYLSNARYSAEQYIPYNAFKKYFPQIKMNSSKDVTEENILQSEIAIVNNFIVLPTYIGGIYTKKYAYTKYKFIAEGYGLQGLYNEYVYQVDYKKYCDKDFKITAKESKIQELNLVEEYYKIVDHFVRFFRPTSSISKKIEELFFQIPKFSLIFFIKFIENSIKYRIKKLP